MNDSVPARDAVDQRAGTGPDSRIRVLLMLPSMHGGGAQRMALHLYRHLDRTQFDVRVGLMEASGPYLASMDPTDYISAPPFVGRCIDTNRGHRDGYTPLLFVLRILMAPVAALYLLVRTRPDVVVTFLQGTSFAAMPGVVLLGRGRLRWIAREGNNTMAVLDNEIPQLTLRRFVGAIIRHCYSRADCVLTISRDLGIGLSRRFDIPCERVATIYNAVDLEAVRRQAAMPLAPGDAAEEPYIIAMGRLEHQKGHDVLLEAYAQSEARHTLRLVIVGEGSERERLRRQAERAGIADRVRFEGFRQNPWSHAAGAEMFVLASRWEGFGNVTVEAMACGVPVIVTDCDFGPREIVTHGQNGLIVGTGSADDLARAIDTLHGDPQLRRKLVAGGLQRACDFDVQRITRQYAALFANQAADLRARV